MKERYVVSISGGKDSMDTALLALNNGEPLTDAVWGEVMFDTDISGEIPEHREFMYSTVIPFLKSEGIQVHIVQSPKTFVELFQKVVGGDGQSAGKIWSWPLCGRCYVNRDLKVRPMERYLRSTFAGDEIIQYIGIANDEEDRLLRLDGIKHISLMKKYGHSENDAIRACQGCGMYSPAYKFTKRNGCFFCPNAKLTELRHLYDYHPDLWARLLALQALPNKATELFTRTQRFCDIDEQFRLDDAQIDLFGDREAIPFDQKKIMDYARK